MGRGCWSSSTSTKDIRLGDRTEAAIKTKSLLGAKILEITPRGDGTLSGPIPLDRTTPPYQLPDALGDLASTISGLNTDQLSDSLAVLADTFSDTPPDLKSRRGRGGAILRRRSTSATRSYAICWRTPTRPRPCLPSAATKSSVWSPTPTRCWPSCAPKARALDQISHNLSAVCQQIKGTHRRQPAHAEARAGQAQRCPDDRRQPQRAGAAGDQGAQRLRAVAG